MQSSRPFGALRENRLVPDLCLRPGVREDNRRLSFLDRFDHLRHHLRSEVARPGKSFDDAAESANRRRSLFGSTPRTMRDAFEPARPSSVRLASCRCCQLWQISPRCEVPGRSSQATSKARSARRAWFPSARAIRPRRPLKSVNCSDAFLRESSNDRLSGVVTRAVGSCLLCRERLSPVMYLPFAFP